MDTLNLVELFLLLYKESNKMSPVINFIKGSSCTTGLNVLPQL